LQTLPPPSRASRIGAANVSAEVEECRADRLFLGSTVILGDDAPTIPPATCHVRPNATHGLLIVLDHRIDQKGNLSDSNSGVS
jgi:hypothetical protein